GVKAKQRRCGVFILNTTVVPRIQHGRWFTSRLMWRRNVSKVGYIITLNIHVLLHCGLYTP
ncbi:hypothetical protein CEXT_599541, partial [Caerostris extrusa]